MAFSWKVYASILLSVTWPSMVAGCGDDDITLPSRDGGTDAQDVGMADAGGQDADGQDAGPDGTVADASADVRIEDAGNDAGAQDAGTDAFDGDAGLLSTCTGDCARTAMTAGFGGEMAPLDVAYFGFNADGTLYIEAHHDAPACPTEDSPSPDRTLVLGAIPVPTGAGPVMVNGSFLEFEGVFDLPPFIRADEVIVVGRAIDLDPRETGFVRLDVDATFPAGGTIQGALYATHCASLDE